MNNSSTKRLDKPESCAFPFAVNLVESLLQRCLSSPKTCSATFPSVSFTDETGNRKQYSEDRFNLFLEDHKAAFDDPKRFYSTFNTSLALHPTKSASTSYQEMTFPSPLLTQWPENNVAPFKWFESRGAGTDTILLLVPGWGRSNQRFEQEFCLSLSKRGIDVGLLTVPLHQERKPAGSLHGEYFISSNILQTISNFRQLTAEILLLIRHFRLHAPNKKIGLIGISAGGFQTALAANCEPIDFFFPIITGCHLNQITWRGKLTQPIRKDLERRGIDEAVLGEAWSIIDNHYLGKHCKAAHVKQFVSIYDNIVPLNCQIGLSESVQHCSPLKVELKTGHFTFYFELSRIAREIEKSIRQAL